MKKLLALLLAGAMALSMVACGGSEPAPDEGGETAEILKIGILQLIEHNALDAAREGFVQALADNGLVDGETIVIDYQNDFVNGALGFAGAELLDERCRILQRMREERAR